MITTHVLNTAKGCPGKDIAVNLEWQNKNEQWQKIAQGLTNNDGRITDLLSKNHKLEAGTYRLTFAVGEYFTKQKVESFYRQITIEFSLKDPTVHYHVPLLLSPFGYSTYRGS